MTRYRIHRLKDHLKQPFRFAPHVSGTAHVKPRDYHEEEEFVEAESPYAAFFVLKETDRPLELGDLLESAGDLQIFKFVGFEPACWPDPAGVAVDADSSPTQAKTPGSEASGLGAPKASASAIQ